MYARYTLEVQLTELIHRMSKEVRKIGRIQSGFLVSRFESLDT